MSHKARFSKRGDDKFCWSRFFLMGDSKLRRDFDHFNKAESYILHSHSRENPVIPHPTSSENSGVVPLLHRIAQMLDFQTEKALAVVKSRINHHHTRQILSASLHALKKLPIM